VCCPAGSTLPGSITVVYFAFCYNNFTPPGLKKTCTAIIVNQINHSSDNYTLWLKLDERC